MSYIGSTPTTQSFIAGTDYFNGTGSQTAFTLSRSVVSVNDIQATVNNVVQVPNDAYTVSGTTITFTSAPSAGTQNVYVRYLSTTTQSITPSQNTVSYATWNSNLQNQTFAFKNRLINGDMTIAQRGTASVNATDGLYTLDRWRCGASANSVFSVQSSTVAPVGFSNSLLVTSLAATSLGTNSNFEIMQFIEGFNTADLMFGTANAATVTLSFWVRSSLTGTFGGSLINATFNRSYPFSYTISAANTWEQKSVTIPGDTAGTWVGSTNGTGLVVCFGLGVGTGRSGTAGAWAGSELYSTTGATSVVGTSGATWYVTGVQLEKGFTATNFDVLPYGTELALCQRYYWKVAGDNSDYPSVGSGVIQNANGGRVYVKHPVSMRTYPTFSYGGTLNIDNGGFVQAAVTSISGSYEGLDTSMLDFAASAGGLTTGRGCIVYCTNASTNFLQASAEL
jgi:hypothetical protein